MGAMSLVKTVARVTIGQQAVAPHIVVAHREAAAHRVGGELVPKGLDAIVGSGSIKKSRMGKVEANIHNSHDNILAGVGLWKIRPGIGRQGVGKPGSDIEHDAGALAGFDAHHIWMKRQCRQAPERNADNVDIPQTGQRVAIVVGKRRD